ncbi:MAG: acylphosphatase [Enterobacteriaceae bacterium]
MSKVGIAAYVTGGVQGVGFRFFTQRKAQSLELTGYVCNLEDGQVKVVAYGEHHQIELLLEWIRAGGAPGARVDKVVTEPREVASMPDFEIRY